MTLDWEMAENRARFINEVIHGDLVVQRRKRADVIKDLAHRNYKRIFKVLAKSSGSSTGKIFLVNFTENYKYKLITILKILN